MKIRTKLTVFSVALIAAAIIACCFLILSFAQQDTISNVAQSGLNDYAGFYSSLCSALSPSGEITPSIQRSYVLSAFRSVAGSNEYTLRSQDDILSNNMGFEVESVMKNAQTADEIRYVALQYKTIHIGDKDYFIAHSTFDFQHSTYDLSMTRDISEIMGRIRMLAVKCLVTSLIVIVVAAILMWLFVFRALKPIKTLQEGANRLAQCQYEDRIPVTGNDELSTLALDFNTMADAIEENIRALHETAERKQAFINDLSHELKTPVTSIMLSSETLLNRKLPPEEANRSLARIYNQSKWLEQLSQKLMTLVLLQGEIRTKPESVSELLESVEESVSDVFQESGISLVIACEIDTLPMDFDLMRAALVNLVDNARKASRKGQSIEIHAYGSIIEVTDHGKGIPKEELSRITEPFYIADRSRSKKHGGVGLGLALAAQIIETHSAQMEIDSILGQGTTVRLAFSPPPQ